MTFARFLLLIAILLIPGKNIFGEQGRALADSLVPSSLTITYTISIDGKKGEDIKETYNGGTKTIFYTAGKARIRLVSLMRTQSIFFTAVPGPTEHLATIVKESGKEKYKSYFNKTQWTSYTKKYSGVKCTLTDDSLQILGYSCRKAIIQLADERVIEAYFASSFHLPLLAQAEPLFTCVPGLVLQYSYAHAKGRITYTAENISFQPIANGVFTIPGKGYSIQSYTTSAKKLHQKASDD